jgi:hypothetical protein
MRRRSPEAKSPFRLIKQVKEVHDANDCFARKSGGVVLMLGSRWIWHSLLEHLAVRFGHSQICISAHAAQCPRYQQQHRPDPDS